jgi:hypothetical protein
VENIRQTTGLFAIAPQGWCDGLLHGEWMRGKIEEAKIKYKFCLQVRGKRKCPRHHIKLTALDNSVFPWLGCEVCADELTGLLAVFDREFVARRTFDTPPSVVAHRFETRTNRSGICANPECRGKFTTTIPYQVFCCSDCRYRVKQLRQNAVRAKRGPIPIPPMGSRGRGTAISAARSRGARLQKQS